MQHKRDYDVVLADFALENILSKQLLSTHRLTKIPAIIASSVFLITWLVLWLPFAVWGAVKLNWRPFQPSLLAQKLPLLAALYLIAPLVLTGVDWWEGSTFATYGAPFQMALLLSMLKGLVAGSLGLMAMFWLQWSMGWLTRTTSHSATQIAIPDPATPATVQIPFLDGAKLDRARQGLRTAMLLLLLGIWVGWTEELIFRGFLQTQLEQGLPAWGAAAIISLFFALLHWVWEGDAIVPQLPGLWLMGMVLVLARWVDHGNLGLAWGLHAGWVWTIASLDTLSLTCYTGKVADWVTGYDGKPLAGATGLLFLLLTAGGLWVIGS